MFCFNSLQSRRVAGENVLDPDRFTAVSLAPRIEEIRTGDVPFEIREIRWFRQGDIPGTPLEKRLQYQLWLYNSEHMERRTSMCVCT